MARLCKSVLIIKERRHMIPETIRGMEKPIERALASGACVESGRPYGQNSHRARCPTHEPHFKHRFMINQAR